MQDRRQIIAYVYFYLGSKLQGQAPLYSGESMAGVEVASRVADRLSCRIDALQQCKRVALPHRRIPYEIRPDTRPYYTIEGHTVDASS